MNQISPLAFVHPEAKLGDNNIIGPFCYIDKNTVIGDNNVFQNSVTLHVGARLGNNNEIFPGASISTKPQDLKFRNEETLCEIGDNNSIRENVTISRGTASKGKTKIGSNNLLMECVHIAHDCIIGDNCVLANAATFAGHVEVEDYAVVGGLTAIHQFTRVGRHAMIGGCSAVTQDVVPYVLSEGNKARAVYINIVGLQRRGFSEEQIKTLREVYKIIFKKKLKLEEALQILEKEYSHFDEAMKVVEFIRKSKRGITR